jgi:hypothetical protein
MFAKIILIFFYGREEKIEINYFININYFIKVIIENLLCKNYIKNMNFLKTGKAITKLFNHIIST